MTPSVEAGVAFAAATFSSPLPQGIDRKNQSQNQESDEE
jgi:hypothetical protein